MLLFMVNMAGLLWGQTISTRCHIGNLNVKIIKMENLIKAVILYFN